MEQTAGFETGEDLMIVSGFTSPANLFCPFFEMKFICMCELGMRVMCGEVREKFSEVGSCLPPWGL